MEASITYSDSDQTEKKSIPLQAYFMFASVFMISAQDSLRQFVLKMDGAGRIPFYLLLLWFLFFLFIPRTRQQIFSAPLIFAIALAIFYTVTSFFFGFSEMLDDNHEVFIYHTITPVLFLVLITFTAEENLKWCLISMIAGMYLSCFFYTINTSMGVWGTIGAYSSDRLSSDTVNSNFLAMYASFTLFLILCYRIFFRLHPALLLLLSLIPLRLVILSASRTGYITCLLVPLLGIIAKIRFSIRNIIVLVIGFLVLLSINSWVMNNTEVGYRFSMRQYEKDHLRVSTGTVLDDIFGERAPYYQQGFDIFVDNPIWGIGKNNYIEYNEVGLYLQRCHIEYVAQLTEGGTVGSFLFLAFYAVILFQLFRKLFTSARETRACWIMLIGGVFLVLITFFGSYFRDYYYVAIGLACAVVADPDCLKQDEQRRIPDKEGLPS